MDFKSIKNELETILNSNPRNYIKAIISLEKGIKDENLLDEIFDKWIDSDYDLLSEFFENLD